jgi:hypothetical protein
VVLEADVIYEVQYANGDFDFARSSSEADTLVNRKTTRSDTRASLLPARIWKMTRDRGSISKLVKTIGD